MSPNAAIQLDNLSFTYPGVSRPALDGVCFTVRAGERVGLLGANGSGKTTLLHCLNGLLVPAAHAVTVRGRIGTVLQNPDDQIIGSTVEEDTAFGPGNMALAEGEVRRRTTAALARCGLEALKDVSTVVLSGGERQRLALAGTLAMESEIFVLDEAVSMLDPAARNEFLDLLDSLSAEGKTIIQVTHDLDDAVRCGRCLVLHRGRLVFDGTPEELLEREELEMWGFVLPESLETWRIFRKRLPGFALSFSRMPPESLAAVLRSVPPDVFRDSISHNDAPSGGGFPAVEPDSAGIDRDADGETALSFEHVSHVYRTTGNGTGPGIHDVSFSLSRKGQVIALIGQSGSGKTTVLKHINALLLPQSGLVRVLGMDTLDKEQPLSEFRSRAVLSVQNPESALFERYAADDVAFGPKNCGIRGQDLVRRVREAMEAAGFPFDEFADREIRSLSGGEKRRAALAGAAAMDSGILLLDEPLAALDGFHQKKILELIEGRRRAGRIVIVSTHSMETAAAADLVGVMAAGRLAALGPPREIFGRRWDSRWGIALPWTAAAARHLAEEGMVPAGAVPLTAAELAALVFKGAKPGHGAETSERVSPPKGTSPYSRPRRIRRRTGTELFHTAILGSFSGPPSTLRNWPAGIKLLAGTVLAGTALAGPVPYAPLAAALFTLAAGWFAGKVGPGRLFRGLVPLAPWLVIFGVLSLVYTWPRLDYLRPLSLIVRVIALVSLVSLYSAVTSLGELLRSLGRFFSVLGLAGRDLTLAVGITFRFVPILSAEAERIITAQLSRGGKKGRLSMMVSMAAPLFLRALERAETLALAMTLRGYGGETKRE